jgi:hypothetical protein
MVTNNFGNRNFMVPMKRLGGGGVGGNMTNHAFILGKETYLSFYDRECEHLEEHLGKW